MDVDSSDRDRTIVGQLGGGPHIWESLHRGSGEAWFPFAAVHLVCPPRSSGIGVNMDSREFQDTARRLAQANTEGDWRSAVSRSYYFVFHFLREFCLTHR